MGLVSPTDCDKSTAFGETGDAAFAPTSGSEATGTGLGVPSGAPEGLPSAWGFAPTGAGLEDTSCSPGAGGVVGPALAATSCGAVEA